VVAASTRLRTCNFARMLDTSAPAVFSVTNSALRDLAVREAAGDQADHLALAAGEPERPARLAGRGRLPRRATLRSDAVVALASVGWELVPEATALLLDQRRQAIAEDAGIG
jgi:hypothetical protein